MDNSKRTGSDEAPVLSQYFANESHSFFDDFVDGNSSSTIGQGGTLRIGPNPMMSASSPTVSQGINQTEYLRESVDTTADDVADEVRDLWEPPHTELGIPPLLTVPRVMSANDLVVPIRDAVSSLLNDLEANQRKTMTTNDVTQDEQKLRQLIDAECFRSAVTLTTHLLTNYELKFSRAGLPVKHTPYSLQLWFTRFALLIKLGQYELCQAEAEPFGSLNRADLFYDFYPDMFNGRKGSMVCFSFRLLVAEIPMYTGSPKSAMDKLADLLAIATIIKNHFANVAAKKGGDTKSRAFMFWLKREARIMHSIINCALVMKDFTLADSILEKLIQDTHWSVSHRMELYSVWGRICLQYGNVVAAEEKFNKITALNRPNAANNVRDLCDRGLLAVAQSEYRTAHDLFAEALVLDPTNPMVHNNIGVCLLYSGKLKEAIAMYEKAINLAPQKALNEGILLNLSTLYELESNNSHVKKMTLLQQLTRYKPDLRADLEIYLKLQSVN